MVILVPREDKIWGRRKDEREAFINKELLDLNELAYYSSTRSIYQKEMLQDFFRAFKVRMEIVYL